MSLKLADVAFLSNLTPTTPSPPTPTSGLNQEHPNMPDCLFWHIFAHSQHPHLPTPSKTFPNAPKSPPIASENTQNGKFAILVVLEAKGPLDADFAVGGQEMGYKHDGGVVRSR
uniref:Uncharacterized protein n=1 Tax=Moniliophthora roreri TaxID=221103 RepID=A0A0W0FK89_MONRR